MSWLIDIFRSLIDTVVTLINFLINSILSLINLIVKIPTYLDVIVSSLNLLPSFLIPFAMAYISIAVVQYVINRRSD